MTQCHLVTHPSIEDGWSGKKVPINSLWAQPKVKETSLNRSCLRMVVRVGVEVSL